MPTIRVQESDGKIQDPGKTRVRKNRETVRWELQGDGELRITFQNSPFGDPPGEQPTCTGGSCSVQRPPREGSETPPDEGHEGRLYKYTIEVTRVGQPPRRLDPDVEVVP